MVKKILYICGARCFRSDMPGRKIADMLDCWRTMGYTVELFSGSDLLEGVYPHVASADTKYVRRWYRKMPLLSPFYQSVSEKLDIEHDLKIEAKLKDIVSRSRPDIIWERASRLSWAPLRVARRMSIFYVHEWIDNLIPYSLSLYHHKAVRIERYKNRESDFIVVVSSKIKEDLVKEGVEPAKILVTHNAVNPDEFKTDCDIGQKYRSELGIGKDEVLIGYLGSYAFYHDSTRLILAADILRRRNAKVKILMVGVGKDYKKCHKLAAKLGLLDSMIIMKPKVPKEVVPKVLSALSVAVLPGSTDIICPIKVQEYMAMELPSVIPDYPANREVVTDGQTGVFFEPHNEESLAEKLLYLAENPELRNMIGRNSRQEVFERFTWKKTWGKALEEIMCRINTWENA